MNTLLNIGFYIFVILLTTAGVISGLFFIASIYVSLRIRTTKELGRRMVANRLKYYLKA